MRASYYSSNGEIVVNGSDLSHNLGTHHPAKGRQDDPDAWGADVARILADAGYTVVSDWTADTDIDGVVLQPYIVTVVEALVVG